MSLEPKADDSTPRRSLLGRMASPLRGFILRVQQPRLEPLEQRMRGLQEQVAALEARLAQVAQRQQEQVDQLKRLEGRAWDQTAVVTHLARLEDIVQQGK